MLRPLYPQGKSPWYPLVRYHVTNSFNSKYYTNLYLETSFKRWLVFCLFNDALMPLPHVLMMWCLIKQMIRLHGVVLS